MKVSFREKRVWGLKVDFITAKIRGEIHINYLGSKFTSKPE